MPEQAVLDGTAQPGSPTTGNLAPVSSETMTVREQELERRRAALQSKADRAELEKQELTRQVEALRQENMGLRVQAPQQVQPTAPITPAPSASAHLIAVVPASPQELADLRVRLAKSERRDTIDDFLADPNNADLVPLRHMIPQTMDVSELVLWAQNMRSLGPAIARGTANNIVRQVTGVSPQPHQGEQGGLLAGTGPEGGYVPAQVLGQAGGPGAIIAGGAGAGAQGTSLTGEDIDAAFSSIRPGDHSTIWTTVTNLMKKVHRSDQQQNR
jgi:hypothetical protein